MVSSRCRHSVAVYGHDSAFRAIRGLVGSSTAPQVSDALELVPGSGGQDREKLRARLQPTWDAITILKSTV